VREMGDESGTKYYQNVCNITSVKQEQIHKRSKYKLKKYEKEFFSRG
jgi:hypothetical protein